MAFYLSGTMSMVDGDTRMQVLTGKQGVDKILVSDASGRADWVGARSMYTGQRFVGELYGGGIVVGVWNEGGDEKVLIASLTDATSTYNHPINGIQTVSSMYWIGEKISALYPDGGQKSVFINAVSTYHGRSNMVQGRGTGSQYEYSSNWTLEPEPFALNFGGYVTGINGYNDWYLPALHEMRMVYDAALIINRVLGENNFKFDATSPGATRYWTSTESSATSVWALDISAQFGFSTMSKGSGGLVRPVRLESTSITGRGLSTHLDATNKKSYNDVTLPGRWSDLVNSGLTSSYSFTFSSNNSTGPTYSSDFGGYLKFNGNSWIDFVSPFGLGVNNSEPPHITIEMWARLASGQSNYVLFGFLSYGVWLDTSNNLGFNTGAGDLYGLTNIQMFNLNVFGNWTHFRFEMTNNNILNNRIYINGTYIPISIVSSGVNNANLNFNGGFGRIGGYRSSNSQYLAKFDLSVFKIYKTKSSVLYTSIDGFTYEEFLGYDKYKRNYEIDINSTHTFNVGPGPGTFSITQNLTLDVPGKRNLRVLRSDSSGFSSWAERDYVFDRPDNERFIGEMYGGGIVVSKWRYPANVFNYLIMSKNDQNQLMATVKQGNSQATIVNVDAAKIGNYLNSVTNGTQLNYQIAGVTKKVTVSSKSSFYEQSTGTINISVPDFTTQTAPLALTSVQYYVVPSVIDVKVNIIQDWLSDLIINLVAPNGNVVNLYGSDGLGSNDNMINTIFSSDTSLPSISTGTPPGYTGRWRWKGALGVVTGAYTSNVSTLSALLAGGTMYGTWTLAVRDTSSGNAGVLSNFSISTPITSLVINEVLATPLAVNTVPVKFGSVGFSVEWSGLPNTLLGNTTTFNGATNSRIMTNSAATHSAAALAALNDGDSFTDWYLPSVYEMTEALGNLAAVGYVGMAGLPGISSTYWTSTEFSATQSYAVNNIGPSVQTKSNSYLVRAFRQARILSSNKTWNGDPWSDAPAGWTAEPYDESNWKTFSGVRTTNLLFHINTSNLNSYRGMLIGLTPSISSLVNGYTGTVLPLVSWSSTECALLLNGTQSQFTATDSIINFGTTFLTAPTPPLTFEFWFKGTSDKDGNMYKGILSTDVVTGSNAMYGVIIAIDYRPLDDAYALSVFFGNGSLNYTSTLYFYTGPVLRRNVWGHVVFVVSSLSNVAVYVNGILYPLSSTGTLASIVNSGGTGRFLIGAFLNNKWVPGGFLSTLRIYNSALNREDVVSNFERDRVRHGL